MEENLKAGHIIFPRHHHEVEALLNQDNIDKLLYRENEQYTALVWAITQHHKEMVRMLLDYGASIEQKHDANNWNALHYAASWGNPEIIKMLFDHVKTLEKEVGDMLMKQRDNETGETPKEIADATINSYKSTRSLRF